LRADRSTRPVAPGKEVTIIKRIIVLAGVVAAFLVLAVPALAFNGYRGDYTTSNYCSICHQEGQPGSAPKVYDQWALTKHATDAEATAAAASLPNGSVCAGCHTANYDPRKVTPSPSGTSWVADPSTVTGTQLSGTSASSEMDIGCSSCHYGVTTGSDPQFGNDVHDTAHKVPYGLMANADICGACHSRFSYSKVPISVTPVPGAGTPTPLIQPQMAIGYPMLGSPAPSPSTGWDPAAPLSAYLDIPAPGWLPTPTATATGLGKLQTYWSVDGADSVWQQTGHDGSAAQYPEWASEGPANALSHANALETLTSEPFWGFMSESDKQACLECHSADFRIMKEAGKAVTSADVQYGVTCVGCHAPHEAGKVKGVWDEEFDAQLAMSDPDDTNGSDLCTQCHNAEIPVGQAATPGEDIHHPMKEMMDGYGAIGVPKTPSVHKGKCIQCHMPPTSYSRGSAQLGGNHTFNIIQPQDAVDASPIPVATATAKATALPLPGTTNYPVITTTVTTTQASMPYSACSTCHDNNAKAAQVITATTATPNPAANPLLVNVTVLQQAAGGDKGLWLQNTIEQRQQWTHDQLDAINADLETAAGKLGFVASSAGSASLNARNQIVTIPAASWTSNQRNFLDAYTNHQFVESEGSYGLHNWAYSVAIVNKSEDQVQSVTSDPWVVSLKANKTSVKVNGTVTYSGKVTTSSLIAATGKAQLQKKKSGGSWANWKLVTLTASGTYSSAIKMTSKGTFYVRSMMAGNATNLTAYSTQAKVVVK
jgi:nitrate/TMAO reductase-like tetraheme cytochrome c subunit